MHSKYEDLEGSSVSTLFELLRLIVCISALQVPSDQLTTTELTCLYD
jgi:hypothetical protein